MSGTSISNGNRNKIFQIFCGRWEEANILDHPGSVLRRLKNYNWAELKKTLGITHIYLLGLWDNAGPIIVQEEQGINLHSYKNRCPSPFALSDHTKVSPLLGTKDDLLSLIQYLHEHQIHVLVDFIPNHTGLAHPWLTNHPEYYKKNEFGNPLKAFSGDVVELDYANPNVCDEMMLILSRLFKEYQIDGVRCDMAHLIPISFWKSSIQQLRQEATERIFIAEAYSDSVFNLSPQKALIQAGFNAVYDEPLFRNARSSDTSIKPLFGHIEFELSNHDCNWVHYVSNHDDPSWCSNDRTWNFQQLFLFLTGWKLLYNGTIWGFSGRLSHHWVQVLPKKYYDPSMLPYERKQWFEWYNHELPEIQGFVSLTDNSVTILWKGITSQGRQDYTFT